MVTTYKGWNEQLMVSAFKQESAYNAGPTGGMIAANACSMKGFEADVTWPDEVVNDKDEVTGSEHGTDQELVESRVDITYREPKAKPNSVAAMAGLVMGSITSTKDGAFTGYKHKIVPVTVGSALNSMQVEHKKGGIQYAYTGVKGKSIKLSGEAGGLVSMEAMLMGSGTRATSATAFPASITESWMRVQNAKVFLESGADISITATLVQDAEDISSATPVDVKTRMRSFEWTFENNLEGQPGFGGAGVLQDADYARRSAALTFEMLFGSQTDLDYFINQDPVAMELDLVGALIDAGGAFKYGLQLIIPRFKLTGSPLPQGGPGDTLTCSFECDVQDDGTNAASILEVYTAQAAYLAA